MEKQEYKREVFVIIGIIIVSMLFILTCNKFDLFQDKGYPVPQGNLTNYNYGLKEKPKKDQYDEWEKIFKRGGNAVEYYGAFRPPAPRTMLR